MSRNKLVATSWLLQEQANMPVDLSLSPNTYALSYAAVETHLNPAYQKNFEIWDRDARWSSLRGNPENPIFAVLKALERNCLCFFSKYPIRVALSETQLGFQCCEVVPPGEKGRENTSRQRKFWGKQFEGIPFLKNTVTGICLRRDQRCSLPQICNFPRRISKAYSCALPTTDSWWPLRASSDRVCLGLLPLHLQSGGYDSLFGISGSDLGPTCGHFYGACNNSK